MSRGAGRGGAGEWREMETRQRSSPEALQDRFQRNVVFVMRLRLDDRAEVLSRVLQTIAGVGARAGEVRLVEHLAGHLDYDVQVLAASDDQMAELRGGVETIDGVAVIEVLDMAMETHRGGACEMRGRPAIRSNTDLRIVYTPGVARVCKAIEADAGKPREFTNLANPVSEIGGDDAYAAGGLFTPTGG